MTEPPKKIDGAEVLQVARLDHSTPTGRTRHAIAGREVTAFAGLALAQYDDDPGVYLFYCDKDWNAVTDTYHDNLENAIAQAEFEFYPIEFAPVAT